MLGPENGLFHVLALADRLAKIAALWEGVLSREAL